MESKSLRIIGIIVAVVFIISGIGKLLDVSGFAVLIENYGLGKLGFLAPCIVLLELLLGGMLLLSIHAKYAAWISFFLMLFFTAAFSYAFFFHQISDCGCFGNVNKMSFPPWMTFSRNGILIVMIGIIAFQSPKMLHSPPAWKLYGLGIFLSLTSYYAGANYYSPILVKPASAHPFFNKPIQQSPFNSYLKTQSDKSYLVFCYSYSCTHCWNSMANLEAFYAQQPVDSILCFATGTAEEKAIFSLYFHPRYDPQDISTDEMKEFVNSVPTAYYIVHDTIKMILTSELPSPYVFLKQINDL